MWDMIFCHECQSVRATNTPARGTIRSHSCMTFCNDACKTAYENKYLQSKHIEQMSSMVFFIDNNNKKCEK